MLDPSRSHWAPRSSVLALGRAPGFRRAWTTLCRSGSQRQMRLREVLLEQNSVDVTPAHYSVPLANIADYRQLGDSMGLSAKPVEVFQVAPT